MLRAEVKPELLRWAVERSRMDSLELALRFPQFEAWERQERQPTLKQLEDFARATHTPVGFLFLAEPIDEPVPIPDFRTIGDAGLERPSPDLLDTVYLCQQRQDWYREFARFAGEEPRPFVGSLSLTTGVAQAAETIRRALRFDLTARRRMSTWTDALRSFIEQADTAGVLVMVSGVVGSNNRRKLDPQEFRGFALVDPLAPLVFINGADTKAAQMFTLAHELAHVWLGQTALSNAQPAEAPPLRDAPRTPLVGPSPTAVERWCNQVAAELLVPLDAFRAEHDRRAELRSELDRLARTFKVSTLVVLRRLHDAGSLRGEAYWAAYQEEVRRLQDLPRGSGGNFYLTLGARASKRFARALVVSTLEGRSSFTEAFRLLGFKKMSTFRELGVSLGLGF